MDRPTLELHAYAADGLLRIALDGDLVNGTTARLRTWMQAHVPRTADRLVLDLSAVGDVDAVGLGALLAAHRRLSEGAQVLLDGASPAVARSLRLSGLDHVLPSAADAVVPQQTSRTTPTTAEVTVSTS